MAENILAESIAKEAKLKASKIISKNDRVQQEYDGVGKNVEETKLEEYTTYKADNEADNAEWDMNKEILTEGENKKKILFGAKPVMPMNDKDLMKKLKEKYNKLEAE